MMGLHVGSKCKKCKKRGKRMNYYPKVTEQRPTALDPDPEKPNPTIVVSVAC